MSLTNRPRILAVGAIAADALALFADRFEIAARPQDDPATIRGVVVRGETRVGADLIDALPAIGIIANIGVGYDNIDVAAAARRGIVVTNTPDVLTPEVADFTLALLLATIRRIPQADRFVREGRWEHGGFPLTTTLRGRTVGIVGMGRIGKAVARGLAGFDVAIAYHGRHRQDDLPHAYHPTLIGLAQAVDTLVVIVPGGADTRNMVDAGILAALGSDGILINVARGTVVDEAALITALQSGTIAAAGLDVFEREPHVPEALRALDNTVLLPHAGSGTHHTRQAMAMVALDNLTAWMHGRGAVTPVPETPLP